MADVLPPERYVLLPSRSPVFHGRVQQPVRQVAGEGGAHQYPETGPGFVAGDQDDLRARQRRLGAAAGAEGARVEVQWAAVGQQVAGAGSGDQDGGALGGDVGDGDGAVPGCRADPALPGSPDPAGRRAGRPPAIRRGRATPRSGPRRARRCWVPGAVGAPGRVRRRPPPGSSRRGGRSPGPGRGVRPGGPRPRRSASRRPGGRRHAPGGCAAVRSGRCQPSRRAPSGS